MKEKESQKKKDAPKEPKKTSPKDCVLVEESVETIESPRTVHLILEMNGIEPGPGDWKFLAIFNGQTVAEGKWVDGEALEVEEMPINLKDPYFHPLVADRPLIFLLRSVSAKSKDSDPLMHPDNRAGANVDLFPLLLGEKEIFIEVPLVMILPGEKCMCKVEVRADTNGDFVVPQVPLMLTLVSAHCLPRVKDGTFYVGAIGLDSLVEPMSVNFGLALSTPTAKKIVWATASTCTTVSDTAYNVPEEDKYIPPDFEPNNTENCNSVYWNAMKRVLIDPMALRDRASSSFLIEIAGIPRTGKLDVRGRYMGFVDAAVLLESGQFGVTTCAKLHYYNEANLPEDVGPLLELPPSSAKVIVRDTDMVLDEFGHNAYIVIRFDLTEPLVPKYKMADLFETIGFPAPDGPFTPMDELHIDPPPEDPLIDVTRIRVEGGALAVHKELSGLACRGAVPMNQSIKRTAANRLLMRVRSMLKQFPPGDCSYIEWQDTVTGQHAASRRAVTASFAPQPPPLRPTSRIAAARCRIAGDNRIADRHMDTNFNFDSNHPWPLLGKAIRCLEFRNDREARNFILRALNSQPRNKFLLWAYGAQEFDKGKARLDIADASFRIAVKGDYSDGTMNAIGWAALHALNHYNNNKYAAFVAAKKMRKSYELQKEWRTFLQRWIDTSGEEEVFWIPSVVSDRDPLLITAALFLCMRCYKFSELLLKCFESGCSVRGSHRNLVFKMCADVSYLRAASLILRRQIDKAIEVTEQGIKKYGPSAILSQMRVTCLACAHGWDGACETALEEAERAGANTSPALLLQAALGGMQIDPHAALQRAARAHKLSPSGHSALIIGRIFAKIGDMAYAERWAAAAVKWEPLLADGWAFLAILAIYERHVDKARNMLRTARQVGPVSEFIEIKLKKAMDLVQIENVPDAMLKDLCFCTYLNE